MDFYRIDTIEKKDGTVHIRPDWKVGRSEDLMTRNGSFYAVWDQEKGLWSTDIYDVQRLVDEDLIRRAEHMNATPGMICYPMTMESNKSKLWDEFQRFLRNSGNNSHNLDEKLVFANTHVKKSDYASRRLPYPLEPGPIDAWDTIVGTLYNEEERQKIEWAIGAIVAGDSKYIQKFLVFYGPPGSGKSTIMNIIQGLFNGYCTVFDARELAGQNNSFATAAFKSNPLVAVQHDGDLSRIYDNTKLNSIVAHETILINEKYRAPYETRSNAFLFMGTNLPVKITDAKSGIIRRLIDVIPSQRQITTDLYHQLMEQVEHEAGAIAWHCRERYLSMGKNAYSKYQPREMMLQTDVFFNYIEAHFDIFKAEDGITLRRAYALYKEWCAETGVEKPMAQYLMREQLKNYFWKFEERAWIDGQTVRSYYSGFRPLSPSPPVSEVPFKLDGPYQIELEEQPSIFDDLFSGMPAQLANDDGIPSKPWAEVTTLLSNIDTKQLHWVKVPESHIVIDFDLRDELGNKNLALNLEAAAIWPATYTELSQGGEGLHLHYTYTGDVHELSNKFDEGIEIKTLLGGSALRRRLTKCNNMNVTPLNEGLPKKERSLIPTKQIMSERSLREQLAKQLRKGSHPSTKSSVDFIVKILDDAYKSGLAYDVTDMRSDIVHFALGSTNHASYCLDQIPKMQFVGKTELIEDDGEETPLVFFDVEVYPNLFVVCWKVAGAPVEETVKMINPTDKEIEPLFKMRLVGFNNRRYDNHILYARWLGYSLESLYQLSAKLVDNEKANKAYFGEAYGLSYTDIFDFASEKMGLKKWEIKLGILHMELDIPWDKPVPEELWDKVVEYCVNDVVGEEAVFNERKEDYTARLILAELSGLSANHTTQQHTAKIIFGDEKNPQREFVYTDLSQEFPGYTFDGKESTYRGEVTGEGGYVYAEPYVYNDVALLDVASMHPTSIEILNLFGSYTAKYSELKEARLAIKRQDYESARLLLDGKLGKFLGDGGDANALSYALKIVINIVYGLTSARFTNPFKDHRNKDNIVAKRGALFMIDLKHAVQEQGFRVAHIKTDSIKIPDATPEIIDFVVKFGDKYGYTFEHETTYKRFFLVNDAVYVAWDGDHWTAVGAQFQHPVVFKELFSHEETEFKDYCETKNVKEGRMYLDLKGNGIFEEMVHIGKTGSFVPVEDKGGDLWRIKDDKRWTVVGTKGYKWITSDMAKVREESGDLNIDFNYFEELLASARAAIMKFDLADEFTFEDFLTGGASG